MEEEFLKKIAPEGIVFQFSLSEKYLNFLFSFYLLIAIFLCLAFLKINYSFLRIFFFFLSLFALFFGFFQRWYLKTSHRYLLTKKRILSLTGILKKELISIDFAKITNIKIEQGFWEKILFNSGKIIIETAGREGPELILEKIEDPFSIKNKIDEIQLYEEKNTR